MPSYDDTDETKISTEHFTAFKISRACSVERKKAKKNSQQRTIESFMRIF